MISAARCKYRSPTGRQYRGRVSAPGTHFCPQHAWAPAPDLSVHVLRDAYHFQNAQGINYSLGALYKLLAQGRISPRRVSALAYITSLLLHTLPAVDNDMHPNAGRPLALEPDPIAVTEETEADETSAAEQPAASSDASDGEQDSQEELEEITPASPKLN